MTREQAVEIVARAIVSFAFGECQPNRGDVFGWIDDKAKLIASFIVNALQSSGAISFKEE